MMAIMSKCLVINKLKTEFEVNSNFVWKRLTKSQCVQLKKLSPHDFYGRVKPNGDGFENMDLI